MEIGGFGTLNDFRLQLDNMNDSRNFRASDTNSFASVLERVRFANNDDQTTINRNQRPGNSDIDRDSQLYQLCLELETFLVKNLLSSMRNTVQKSGLVDDSFAGKIYEDMLWDEYAKGYTQNAGFGLAEQAYRQLSGF
jgi:flagellar protein FlgJ